jgi:MFS family permease
VELRRQLDVLRGARGFRLLFLATTASSLGTWLAYVALVVDVFDRTHDASWVSALLIVEFLPTVVIGFFAGLLIDRIARRRLLVGSDLARAVVFVGIALAPTTLSIVALAFAAGVATSVFRPAVYAGLPVLVRDRDLPRANGLLQSAENLTWAAGSLLGGLLVATSSPTAAYWFNAVTFLVSAALIARIREPLEEAREEPKPGESAWRQLLGGVRLVRSSRALLVVLIAWSIALFATGAANVAEVVLAKDVFDAGDFGFGLMVAAAAVGLVLGSLAAGAWLDRRGVARAYPLALVAMAVGWIAAGLAPSVWPAAVLISIGGFGNGAAVVCNAVLIQRGVVDRLRGRALTLAMSVTFAFQAIGTIAGGPLTNVAGARQVWVATGTLLAIAAGVAMLLARNLRAEPIREPAPATAAALEP